MRTELIAVETSGHHLDGLWYEPNAPAEQAVQVLHGNCMNFYTGPSRFLPPHLAAAGLSCLTYNRRGHDILGTLNSRQMVGGALQLAHEAVEDNVAARAWLGARGFADPLVVGHSNGGTLSVRHVADHPGTPALVLLSAHLGGHRIVHEMSANGLFGRDRLDELLGQAREMIGAGRGDDLMALPGWWYVISARSLVDYATHTPDLLDLAPRIRCPVLFVRGDGERPHVYPAEAFAERCSSRCEVVIVPNCDHFYTDREGYVADLVVDWLRDKVPSHPEPVR